VLIVTTEVEALVSETVQDILSQRSQGDEQGNELIKKVVEYLESEPSWIELYSATGELLIPCSLDVGEGLTETFASVQKVSEGSKASCLLTLRSLCRDYHNPTHHHLLVCGGR